MEQKTSNILSIKDYHGEIYTMEQTMMDDAERDYDGGLQAMAEGGMMEQDEEETTSSQFNSFGVFNFTSWPDL